MAFGKVYIIVLNYNGWHHTIECVESLLKLRYPSYQILIIDNNSSDGSFEHIRLWAEGGVSVWISETNPLRSFGLPTYADGIPSLCYGKDDAERGGDREAEERLQRSGPFPLVLIQTGMNLGFTGGNNVGIRYALHKGDADFIWLINNDTVVEPESLTCLVSKCMESPGTGVVGSVHLDYAQPDCVQTIGGVALMQWLGITRNLYKNRQYTTQLIDVLDNALNIDIVSGCSMLVTRDAFERVGLMDEDYFMYWEDADWCERARRSGFTITYAIKSAIYHKQGQSGSLCNGSYLSTYNCFRFYRKYFPSRLPVVLCTRMVFILLTGMKHASIEYIRGAFRAYAQFIKSTVNG